MKSLYIFDILRGLDKRQLRRLAIICSAVALLVVAVTVIIVLVVQGDEDEPPTQNSSSLFIPEGMRLVDDLYSGELIIPDFDIPQCTYDPKGFTSGEDGFTRYKDAVVGIDVSEFQGEIDWYAVKAAGVDFAIIRLGYRGMTQGLLEEDTRFAENFHNSEGAGILRGVYFFSQAVTAQEAEAEAEFVIEKLGGEDLDYPVVFDWEDPVPSEGLPAESLRALDCPGETVTECAVAFCERIKKAGYTPCVYFNKSQAYKFYDLEKLKEYAFWLAEYNPAPSLFYDFRMWQYSDQGTIPGIGVTVDLDLCFKPYGQ